MKYISLFFFCSFFYPHKSLAQEQVICYELLKKQGEAAYNRLDFEMAVKKYRAARICPDKPINSNIEALVVLARNGYIDKIKEARSKAEAAQKTAITAEQHALQEKEKAEYSAKQSKAGMLAFQAQVAIEQNNPAQAICLAWSARQLVEDSIAIVVKRAFGDATYHYSHLKSPKLSANIQTVSFAPNEHRILCTTQDHKLFILNLDTSGIKDSLKILFESEPFESIITAAKFSPDGQQIFVAVGAMVKMLDRNGQLMQEFSQPHPSPIAADFSPDSKNILICPGNTTAELWDVKGALLSSLSGHQAKVFKAAFSPDNRFIFTLAHDKTVKIWTTQGVLVTTLDGNLSWLTDAQFSNDGSKILTTSVDGFIKIWATNGRLLQTLKGHKDMVKAAKFSPSGKQVLSYGGDKSIILWNELGEIVFQQKHPRGAIRTVDFSKNGLSLLSASMDGTAKLWDLKGTLLMNLDLHKFAVDGGHFSPDNNRILTFSEKENFVRLSYTPSFMYSKINNNNKQFFTFCEDKNRKEMNREH